MSEFLTVRYVGYCTNTFRPKYQGVCQVRDYADTKAISPEGTDTVLLTDIDPVDLTPYDHVFGECDHAVDGICPIVKLGATAIASANGKSAADAITRIDQLNIQESFKFAEASVTAGASVSASLTIS